jgi:RHS repeat-associated protein
MADDDPPTLEALLTTDEELDPREAHIVYELRELVFRAGSPAPEDLAQISRLLVRWATVRNAIADGEDVPERPGVRDLETFFPEASGAGIGNLTWEELRQVFRNIEQYPEFVQGLTEEEAQVAQLLAEPVMMFNGQYVHTAVDARLAGGGMDFVFTRTYKNQSYYRGPLGINWDHSCNLYLRAEFSGRVIARSTGQLREDRFVLHEHHGYFVPPDGVHDVIVGRDEMARHAALLACCADDLAPGHPYSFVLRAPGGQSILYAPIAGSDIHHAVKMRDRFGHALLFTYDQDARLATVAVNHPERLVRFAYDLDNRITEIRAWGVSYPWRAGLHERTWRYEYDDFGDLVAVTSPATGTYAVDGRPTIHGFPQGRTSYYEYSSPERQGELRHNLVRLIDPAGQIYLENEYGETPGRLDFNRVVRQRQGRGAAVFEYEDIVQETSPNYARAEQPAHKTTFFERDGHPADLYYNDTGQLLARFETVRDGGGTRTLAWRFRYNPDGALVASLSPDGAVVQQYYGRDDYYRRAIAPGDPDVPASQDAALTPQERLRWGNRLATVRRGAGWSLRQLLSAHAGADGVADYFPDVLHVREASDIVSKSTYSADYQQILTESDPRATTSADPRAIEPAPYAARLIRYEYGALPQAVLQRVRWPDVTFPEPLPDGTAGLQGLTTEYPHHDARGRALARRDPAGTLTRWEYYGAADGVRAGYLRREIRQHTSLALGQATPDSPRVVWSGVWARAAAHRRSDGAIGAGVEIAFDGCGAVLYQDEDRAAVHGQHGAVQIELVDAAGHAQALAPWDQVQDPSYAVDGLACGEYLLRLRDLQGLTIGLGRIDLFTELRYEVNEAGATVAVTNPRGFRSEVIVNEADQVIATLGPPPLSYPTLTSYDATGRMERSWQVLDPPVGGERFAATVRTYDEQNNLLSETVGVGAAALATRHFYDASDRRVRTVFPRGNDVRYQYDERNLMIAVIRASCTPDESILRSRFDGDGRKVALIDPLGRETRSAYDALGRVVAVTDALGHVQRIEYDKRGAPTHEFFFERRGTRYVLLTCTAYAYDEQGRKLRMIQYLFDEPIEAGAFDAARIDQHPGDDAVFPALRAAVLAGRVSELRTDSYLDANGRVFRSVRYGLIPDPAGGVVRTRVESGEQGHDGEGRVAWSRDALGHTTVTTCDANGNVIRRDVHEPVRDAAGVVLHTEVRSHVYRYDALNREIEIVDPLGRRTRTWYDSRGNPTRTEDPLGNSTSRSYDVFGRLTSVRRALTLSGLGGGAPAGELVSRFEYDANSNVVARVDPRGVVSRADYDALDRRVRLFYDSPRTDIFQEWRYDAAGRATMYRDENGLRLLRSYDPLGRTLQSRQDASGVLRPEDLADETGDVESFVYDGFGRVLLQSNGVSAIETSYDSLGRPLRERTWWPTAPVGLAQPLVLHRTFDIFSNLTRLAYPDGRTIRYDHDELHRVVRVAQEQKGDLYPGHAATPHPHELVAHQHAGLRRSATRYANQAGVAFAYDAAGRLIDLRHHGAAGALHLRIQQLHDAIGNKRLENNVRPDPANPAATVTQAEGFFFDSVRRLTRYGPRAAAAVDPAAFAAPHVLVPPAGMTGQQGIDAVLGDLDQGLNHTYRYDESDNRRESLEPGHPHAFYTPNRLNQYEQVVDAAGAGDALAYDTAGNLIQSGATRYWYNARRQITRAETGGQLVARFRYDVQGRLLSIEHPQSNALTFLASNGPDVIAEYEPGAAGWTCRAQYVHARELDGIYQLAAAGTEYYYHRNGVGSTRGLTDRDGAWVEYEYEPFGALRAASAGAAAIPNVYRFAGRRYDPVLDAYDFRSRVYRPAWGRFLQRDPKGETSDANLYVALGNNPGVYVDPMGTEKGVWFVEADEAFILSTPEERYRTAKDARLQEWWEQYRQAETAEDQARMRRELRNEFAKDYAQAMLAWYIISAAGAVGAELPIFVAGRLGLQLSPALAGVLGGTSGALSEEGASWALGKQVTWENFLVAGVAGGLAGGLLLYFGSRLADLRPIPGDTTKVIPRTRWSWDRSPRESAERVMADYYRSLQGDAYTGGSKASAADVLGQPDADWLHLWMKRGGGADLPYNLVAGSRGSNYVMLQFEHALLEAAKSGRIVETEIVAVVRAGTDAGKCLRYRAWIDGEEVMDATLDLVRTQTPTTKQVNWFRGQGEYNPKRRGLAGGGN